MWRVSPIAGRWPAGKLTSRTAPRTAWTRPEPGVSFGMCRGSNPCASSPASRGGSAFLARPSQRFVQVHTLPRGKLSGDLVETLGQRANEIGTRDNAHQLAVAQHGHALDVVLVHQMRDLACRHLLGHGDDA